MLLRRLLLLVAVLFMIAAIASAIAPRPETGPAPLAPTPAPPAAIATPRVTGHLPADGVVRADVGDVVDLSVTAEAEDTVQIVALGLDAPVDPQTPARFELVADQPGRFPVTLQGAGTRLGMLEVSAPR